MMKVLVSGMTASQTREIHSIGGLIAGQLRQAGHEVTVAKPSLERTMAGEQWDHVYVGLGPLHGLTTSSMYGALALIGTHPGRVTLFLDDLDSAKIGSGFRVMRNKPERLIKSFFQYKREWELAKQPEVHAWLMKVINWIISAPTSEFPPMIVPSFTYDEAYRTASLVSGAAGPNVVSVDFSSVVPSLAETHPPMVDPPDIFEGYPARITEDDWYWVTDHPMKSKSVTDMCTSKTVFHCREERLSSYVPDIMALLLPFRGWSPLYTQMLRLDIPVTTHWRVGARIGKTFDYLAVEIEQMNRAELRELAAAQRETLAAISPSSSEILNLLAKNTSLC